jgi:hypothetical protein
VYVKMVIARRIVMDDERLAAWEIYSSARAATRIEARSRRIAGEGLSRSEPQPPTQGDHQSAREIARTGEPIGSRGEAWGAHGRGGAEELSLWIPCFFPIS